MTNTFEKKPIYTYLREYQNELRIFNLDTPTRNKIKDFFKQTTGKELTDFKNITGQLYKHIEETAQDNVMQLDIKKYCELKGINFNYITELENSIETWVEPNIENFTSYTTSEKANQKLKDFHELKKAFNKFSTKYGLNPNALNLSLKNVCSFDGHCNDIFATPEFINN